MNLWNKFLENVRLRRFVVLLGIIGILYVSRSIISVILLTFIFTFLITRLIMSIHRHVKIPSQLIVIAVYLALIGLIYLAVTVYVPKLISQSEALYEASGNIRERTRDLRKAAKKIKTDGAPLTEQVGEQLNALRSTVSELLNLVDAFEESSGKKHEASSGSLEGCKTLEIRDGRLVIDLAPNSGVVAFVNRD